MQKVAEQMNIQAMTTKIAIGIGRSKISKSEKKSFQYIQHILYRLS